MNRTAHPPATALLASVAPILLGLAGCTSSGSLIPDYRPSTEVPGVYTL